MSIASYSLKDQDLILDSGAHEYILRVRDLPADEKPREKLLTQGPAPLSVHELLAIILNNGTRKEGVLEMAHRIVKEYGEKTLVSQTDPASIAKTLDIPLLKACQIVAAFELGRRFFKQHGHTVTLRTPKQVYDYVRDMHALPKEHLRGLYVSSHYRLVHDEVISIGSVTANIIHPREVFKPAIEYSAVGVILVHNHPSGVAEPSAADREVTRQICQAGKILGIDLLDHLIVTKKTFANIPLNE